MNGITMTKCLALQVKTQQLWSRINDSMRARLLPGEIFKSGTSMSFLSAMTSSDAARNNAHTLTSQTAHTIPDYSNVQGPYTSGHTLTSHTTQD